MADDKVRILIEAEDKASSALKEVANNAERTAEAVTAAGRKSARGLGWDELRNDLNKVSNTFLGLGAAATGIAGVVTAIGLDLNKAIAEAGTVAGFTADKFKDLEMVARDISKSLPLSATEVAQGMAVLASEGVKGVDVIKMIPSIAELAAGTMKNVGDVANYVSNTMSRFGLSVEETQKVVDVFAYVSNELGVNIDKLGTGLLAVGTMAKEAGLSFEETAAALALLNQAGIESSQAAMSLRMIIGGLVTPSKVAAESIKALGLSLEQLDPTKHTLGEIVTALANANASFQDLAYIVGDRAAAALKVLIDNASRVDELTTSFQNASGEAKKLADEMAKTPYAQYQMALTSLKEMAYSIFPAVFEALKTVLKPLQDLVNWFNSLPEGVQNAIAKLVVFGGVGLTAAGAIGKLVVGVSDAIEIFKKFIVLDVPVILSKIASGFSVLPDLAVKAAHAIQTAFAAVGATIATVAGVVGLLIFDLYKAIELVKILVDLFKIKKETKRIETETRMAETANEVLRYLTTTAPAEIDRLRLMAQELVAYGRARTIPEAITQIAATGAGALAIPREIRERAERVVREYKIRVDISDFDAEWRKAGENLKRSILTEIFEGARP